MLEQWETPGLIRRRGLLKAVVGLVALYLSWRLGLIKVLDSVSINMPIVMWFLVALILLSGIGLLETISGRRFGELSSAWDAMNPWRRILLTILLSLGIALDGWMFHLACVHSAHKKPLAAPTAVKDERAIQLETP